MDLFKVAVVTILITALAAICSFICMMALGPNELEIAVVALALVMLTVIGIYSVEIVFLGGQGADPKK